MWRTKAIEVIALKKILFIVNPKAGTKKAQKYLADILGEFCRAGHTVITHVTTGLGDAVNAVKRYAATVDMVVCCGGDGTFNETINGIMQCGSNVPIGYIPAGSTNDFAASLKLPTQPLEAARAILGGKPVRYDIGQFGRRYFSYVASFGAFTRASYTTPQSVKNALGHTAYILEGIQELSQIRPLHVKLELDDQVIEDDFLFGAISNSTSVGGILTLDPTQVDMRDGRFEILLVRVPRKMGEISECIQALSTQKYNCQMITFRSSSHVRVTAETDMVWTLDGERAEGAPIVDIYNHQQAIGLLQKG